MKRLIESTWLVIRGWQPHWCLRWSKNIGSGEFLLYSRQHALAMERLMRIERLRGPSVKKVLKNQFPGSTVPQRNGPK